MFENEETVAIHTAENDVEEMAVCAALDEAGIEYLVQQYEDHALDGLFTRTLGHSRIFVLEHDANKALGVIRPVVARFRSSEDEGGQDAS